MVRALPWRQAQTWGLTYWTVVNPRRLRDLRDLDDREAHLPGDRLGEERDAAAVIAGARVAQIDQRDERLQGRAFLGEDRLAHRVLVRLSRPDLRQRIEPGAA